MAVNNFDNGIRKGKGDACKPTQYIVTSLQTDYIVNHNSMYLLLLK